MYLSKATQLLLFVLYKRNCEQIALLAFNKRMKRVHSLKKNDKSKEWHEWSARFMRAKHTDALSLSKKEHFTQKILLFSLCFWHFFTAFPLFVPKSESLPSLFDPLSFFEEWMEQFTHSCSWKRVNGSFTHKNWVIHSKNQRANSQPWYYHTISKHV